MAKKTEIPDDIEAAIAVFKKGGGKVEKVPTAEANAVPISRLRDSAYNHVKFVLNALQEGDEVKFRPTAQQAEQLGIGREFTFGKFVEMTSSRRKSRVRTGEYLREAIIEVDGTEIRVSLSNIKFE